MCARWHRGYAYTNPTHYVFCGNYKQRNYKQTLGGVNQMLNFRPTLDIACATSYLCNHKTTKRQNNRAAFALQQRLDWSASKP